jgi:uncharacterized protein YecE (DUF72 family)
MVPLANGMSPPPMSHLVRRNFLHLCAINPFVEKPVQLAVSTKVHQLGHVLLGNRLEGLGGRWPDATPAKFVFAVKGSRFLTHNKKLKDPENAVENLVPRAARLHTKLGPILFQLPPKWQVNVERLENLLAILPRDVRYAFEFRELSWMTNEVMKILQQFNAAFCIYELAGYHSPLHLTADFTYVRLHGPTAGKYQGSYSEDRLQSWARQIEIWSRQLKAVYIYFDNDQGKR